MQKVVLFLLFFLVLFAHPLKKVEFVGNKALKREFLEKNLNILVEKSWYEFYKDTTPKIDQKVIKPLKESLINLYKSEGFYKVDIDVVVNKSSIIFKIDENDPILITSIENKLEKKYKNLVTFKVGDRFEIEKFKKIRKKLKQRLLKDGFCNAKLTTKAYVDLKRYSVRLVYKLQKNKRCYFGDIYINSPKDIPKRVILSRLYYKKGDFYSSKKILKSYETLLGLDVFDVIDINQNIKKDFIDTNITLTRKKNLIKRTIGVGYETKYGTRVMFGWEQRDFKGGAKKLSFNAKYSTKEQFIKNSFFIPAFVKEPIWDRYIDFKNDLIISRTIFDKFDEKKISDKIHFLKDIEFISIDGGLSYEKIKIFKKDKLACNIKDGDFILLSPYIKAIIDNRDSKIDPKNGIYLSAYLESGLTYLASSTSYSKLILEGRAIKTLYGFTVAAKGKVGMIKEFQKSLPESKLFFAGGSFSNRAYGYKRLGAFDSSCTNMGAKTLVDNSLEISHHLWKKFSWAIFWDATMLSIKESEFNLDFIHSYGFGLRYKTPIGPFKIDYGVNAKDHSIYAISFQIGQSF